MQSRSTIFLLFVLLQGFLAFGQPYKASVVSICLCPLQGQQVLDLKDKKFVTLSLTEGMTTKALIETVCKDSQVPQKALCTLRPVTRVVVHHHPIDVWDNPVRDEKKILDVMSKKKTNRFLLTYRIDL